MFSTLDLIADGWAFTQCDPIGTGELITLAQRRGFRLKSEHLESLYRQQRLVPFVVVHDDPQDREIAIIGGPSKLHRHRGIDQAAMTGRLTDPAQTPLAEGWRFDDRRIDDPRGWWNGLLYSRWQLLELGNLTGSFRMDGYPLLREGSWATFEDWGLEEAGIYRQLAIVLAAIEPRYFPIIDEGWARLRGVTPEEWYQYRDAFNPTDMASKLGASREEVARRADHLLLRASSIDPLGPWSRLSRHATPKHQQKLKGLALLALDFRQAAEMLLLFAGDLGEAPPPSAATFWAPINERLSRHGESIDAALQSVGVSPHTRVALIVEGETEVLIARKILEHLGHGAHPDGLEIVSMHGVTDEERILKLAVHLATPIITQTLPDSYNTLRPLCRVVIATDPERPMDRPEKFRAKLLRLINEAISAQGIKDLDPDSADWLVTVRTWEAAFEFEHFTDLEIAEAMLSLPWAPLPRGLTHEQAIEFVADARTAQRSLKKRAPRLSKPALAEALWPLLRDRIDAAFHHGTELPPIAEVVYDAHALAADAFTKNWVLTRKPGSAADDWPTMRPG